MTWSDAARRAAALVRQAHARSRKKLEGMSFEQLRGATTFEGYLPQQRKVFATELKRYRAGVYGSNVQHLQKTSEVAAASTKVRNALRKGAKIHKPVELMSSGRGAYHAARLRIQRRGY